ncbi:MAG: serine hydrolase [Bacteroidales bacterium]|nr:serine hydrolase [Bacteroidales bacterium]MDD4670899.1 serine hydrolase [Bacteroidales bacterium]
MKKHLFTFMVMASIITTACTPNPDKEAAKQIDTLCSQLFPADEPGAAVLVLKGDNIIFDKGYGIADIDTKVPIDGNTFFNIASVSKQFTATAAMQLAEQGRISLDDSVKMYFPEYKADFYNRIKIKHLLSHSSGIPDARDRSDRNKNIFGTEVLAMSYLPDLNFLNFEPGTNYEYINPTFLMVACIVEKVSGKPFTEYVRENIFIPAGMDKTLYFEPDAVIENMAHGYEYEDVENMPEERTATEGASDAPKKWYEYDYGEETFFATKADGGIYTSTHQFVNWEKALRDNKVMSEQSRIDAQSPHTPIAGSTYSDYQNRPNTFYGYGWFIEPETDSSPLKIYHTGDNGGFKILAARYPEQNILVLVFANRADWDRYKLMQDIEKALGM